MVLAPQLRKLKVQRVSALGTKAPEYSPQEQPGQEGVEDVWDGMGTEPRRQGQTPSRPGEQVRVPCAHQAGALGPQRRILPELRPRAAALTRRTGARASRPRPPGAKRFPRRSWPTAHAPRLRPETLGLTVGVIPAASPLLREWGRGPRGPGAAGRGQSGGRGAGGPRPFRPPHPGRDARDDGPPPRPLRPRSPFRGESLAETSGAAPFPARPRPASRPRAEPRPTPPRPASATCSRRAGTEGGGQPSPAVWGQSSAQLRPGGRGEGGPGAHVRSQDTEAHGPLLRGQGGREADPLACRPGGLYLGPAWEPSRSSGVVSSPGSEQTSLMVGITSLATSQGKSCGSLWKGLTQGDHVSPG
ncbi:translation initiation factor IF-2-like [Camelus ferus]|uniref:Translation initiation factor IF-2-like n=1 Tax=Camelus ferus TaxID=419612 RepID=A0A8B8U663_CAMFR|nr:translation initiation factor IF-2-like [Camelus ferus]